MGLYRVTRQEAMAIPSCGHDVTYALPNLRVRGACVVFPPCPECQSTMLVVRCVVHPEGAPAAMLERDVAIHTLHQRVCALGLFADASAGEGVEAVHPLAKDDDVVEAVSARRNG